MAAEAKLSHTAAMILQAISRRLLYGFSIMEMTGLPSGTVYPAMRRLERDELIRSAMGEASPSPTTNSAPRASTTSSPPPGRPRSRLPQKRYPLLARLFDTPEKEHV